jgi:dTDP-4-amino-4,6-dideoxygalactose transaminase
MASWNRYHEALAASETAGLLRRPIVPAQCRHNAHMYYVLLAPYIDRQGMLAEFRRKRIHSVFHYVPLHSSPAGRRFGRTSGGFDVTNRISKCLVRLPLWVGLTDAQQDQVIELLQELLTQ